MGLILIFVYSILTIYIFLKRKEYVLAVFLVGQPILKMMLLPFPNIISRNLFLIYYVGLGVVSTLLLGRKQKTISFNIRKLKPLVMAIFFGMLLFLSALYSPSFDSASMKLVDYITVNLLIVFLTIYTIKDKYDFNRVMKALVSVSILVGIATVLIIYQETGNVIVRLGTSVARDIEFKGVNFAVSIWYGRRIGLGLLASAFLYQKNPQKINLYKSLVLLILFLLSVSRGPIIAMVTTILSIIFIRGTIYKKVIKKVFVIAILFFPIIAMSITTFISNNLDVYQRLINFSDANAITRIVLYKKGIDLIISNPFGVGLGGFQHYTGIPYPHNIFIEILVDSGWIALLFFIMWISITTMRGIKLLRKNSFNNVEIAFSLSVLIFGLLNAQVSGDISSNEFIWLGLTLTNLSNYYCKKSMELNNHISSEEK